MNVLGLVTYLRTNLLDDTGGQGVDWVGHTESDYDSYQLRWSNEELVSNINEAINQVYRRATPAKDLYTISICPNKDTYKLPSYLLKIVQIKNSHNLEVKETEIESIWFDSNVNKIGEPMLYTTDYLTSTIKVYPTPDKEGKLLALIYRLPLKALDLYSQDDIELKDEFVLPMLHYAAALCYMKDEANVLDPNRSQFFMALFDREFPFTSSYSTLRKSRTANKSIKYGGL
jgi:hypothetical protein